MSKKLALVGKGCVACGTCEKSCPKSVVSVYKGVQALVDASACAGCGKCAKVCPADVISLAAQGGTA